MHRFLATTAERALIELTILAVSAWQATPVSNAKRVRTFLVGYNIITCLCILYVDFDECSSYPCQNGGTCTDGIDGYECNCVPGHTGVFCQTGPPFLCFNMLSTQIGINCSLDIGECTSTPCQNNGTCVDEINQFTCICADGFSGNVCETS